MKKLLIAFLIGLLPMSVFAAPLLRQDGFEFIKTKKHYKVQVMFMTGVQFGALKVAVKEWNKAMGYEFITFEYDRTQRADIYISVMATPQTHGIALPFNSEECTIIIGESMPVLPSVYVHEIGHCLGLAHNDMVPNIMSSQPYPYTWDISKDIVDTLKKEQSLNSTTE